MAFRGNILPMILMLPTFNQEHFTLVTLLHWNSASQPLPSLKPRVGASQENIPKWSNALAAQHSE